MYIRVICIISAVRKDMRGYIRREDDQVYVDYVGYPDMDFEKGKVIATICTGSIDDLKSYGNMGVYKGKLYVIDPESGHIIVITEDDIK